MMVSVVFGDSLRYAYIVKVFVYEVVPYRLEAASAKNDSYFEAEKSNGVHFTLLKRPIRQSFNASLYPNAGYYTVIAKCRCRSPAYCI